MKQYAVYIVQCSDRSYYTGMTNNVERRVAEHNDGKDPTCYTYKRRPAELVYRADFREVWEAIAWETKVKGWNAKKKEALIRGEYEQLPYLSRRRQPYRKHPCHPEEERPASAGRDVSKGERA